MIVVEISIGSLLGLFLLIAARDFLETHGIKAVTVIGKLTKG